MMGQRRAIGGARLGLGEVKAQSMPGTGGTNMIQDSGPASFSLWPGDNSPRIRPMGGFPVAVVDEITLVIDNFDHLVQKEHVGYTTSERKR